LKLIIRTVDGQDFAIEGDEESLGIVENAIINTKTININKNYVLFTNSIISYRVAGLEDEQKDRPD
jgi:hypothetical protein